MRETVSTTQHRRRQRRCTISHQGT
jgi:hypothetical protein